MASGDLDMDGAWYKELWHACAGPLASVPREGELVYYFPQGHLEQLQALTRQGMEQHVRYFDLPSNIVCRVVNVQLLAEPQTDEVYAQITLLPKSNQGEYASRDPPVPEPRSNVLSLCKTIAASDTGTNSVLSISGMDADSCLPPRDMSLHQELVAMDLHRNEWHFQHIFQDEPGCHVLTTGWSEYVTSKKLVAGDAFILQRGDDDKLRVGVRRNVGQQTSRPSSIISSESMYLGLLATASNAILRGTMFTIFYKPRTIRSNFIVNVKKYIEAIRCNFFVGMRFKMRFEGEEVSVQSFSGTIVGFEDYCSSMWSDSKWRSLKVQWDEPSSICPERVSPWEVEPFVSISFSTPYVMDIEGNVLPCRRRGYLWEICSLFEDLYSLICKNCELFVKYKKHTLAVVFLLLEAISVTLDQFGRSKQGFVLGAFLLSAFGFAVTVYNCIKGRTISARRLQAERQLGVVEVVFSVVQLVTTFIDYLLAVMRIKNKYDASLLPLAFAVILVVFVFKKDENVDSHRRHRISLLGSLSSFSLINIVMALIYLMRTQLGPE
ncbi:hypothetical protein ACOSP7_003913 [Xanthoceras sorbifolium]